MSRIGRMPVEIPAGVEIKLDEAENTVTVKGPKGTLTRTFSSERNQSASWSDQSSAAQHGRWCYHRL